MIGRFWEFEVGKQNEPSVVGKIHEKLEFWENQLEASPFVLGIIKNVYRLPFIDCASRFYAKNNASSLKNKKFVEDSIEQLLSQGCIEEVMNPLTVAEDKNCFTFWIS